MFASNHFHSLPHVFLPQTCTPRTAGTRGRGKTSALRWVMWASPTWAPPATLPQPCSTSSWWHRHARSSLNLPLTATSAMHPYLLNSRRCLPTCWSVIIKLWDFFLFLESVFTSYMVCNIIVFAECLSSSRFLLLCYQWWHLFTVYVLFINSRNIGLNSFYLNKAIG